MSNIPRRLPKKYEIHGLSYTKLYSIWENMNLRCYNLNDTGYHRYGGRGIQVCNEWRESPETFIRWARTNGWKPELELNRINNDGHYTPDNCNFVTHAENGRNSRAAKLNWDIVKEIREFKRDNPKCLARHIKRELCLDIHLVQINRILRNERWREETL